MKKKISMNTQEVQATAAEALSNWDFDNYENPAQARKLVEQIAKSPERFPCHDEAVRGDRFDWLSDVIDNFDFGGSA